MRSWGGYHCSAGDFLKEIVGFDFEYITNLGDSANRILRGNDGESRINVGRITSYFSPDHDQRKGKAVNPTTPAILLEVRGLDDTERIGLKGVKLVVI